jgi:hypothetical protein
MKRPFKEFVCFKLSTLLQTKLNFEWKRHFVLDEMHGNFTSPATLIYFMIGL